MSGVFLLHFNPYSLLFLFSAFCSISLFAFAVKRRGTSLTVTLFLTIVMTTAFYAGAQFLAVNAYNPDAFRFWNLILFFPLAIIPPLQLSFVLSYMGKESILRQYWYPFLTFFPTILFLFFIWALNVIISPDIHVASLSPWGYVPGTKTLGEILIPTYQLLYYGLTIVLLGAFYSKSLDIKTKIKIALLIIAVFIPIGGSIFFFGIFPSITGLPVFPAAPILVTVMVFVTFYAVLKYGSSFFTPVVLASRVFETMNEAIIGISSSYTIEFINQSGEKLFHASKQQIENKKLATLFPSQAYYEQIINQLLIPLSTQEQTSLQKIEIQTLENKKIPVAASATKLFDKDSRTSGYILILTDISKVVESYDDLTEKVKEIQQRNVDLEQLREDLLSEKQSIETKIQERTRDLHAEHARLQASINSLSLGFIMTDRDKSIILINKAVKDIFYLAYPETGISLQDIQNRLPGFNLLETLENALHEQKRVARTDVKTESKFLNIFITPIIIEERGDMVTIGSVIIIEDETAIKLIQQSKEEFFNIASHELRTPLTAINGFISLIKQLYFDQIKDEQLKQMLTNISVSSARLISLVNDLLDSSKLEQGKIQVKQEPCDILILIDEAIKETQSIAIQKKIYLKSESEIKTLTVIGDKERLKQVIINLISNAMKFTTEGGITVKTAKLDNGFVKVIVQDTGRGISEQNKTLLFHKFQQAQENAPMRVEGTGLGLYISKLLVEKMGGRIQLEWSTVGKGTAFSFTVPAA